MFITRQFPDSRIPFASWADRNNVFRSFFKIMWVSIDEFLPENYHVVMTFATAALTFYMCYERLNRPPIYNRIIHLLAVSLESLLLV